MAKEMVEIKSLINWAWRWHIETILMKRRDSNAVQLISYKGTDKPIYSEADLLREQIRILNSIINIPKVTVEIEVPDTVEELLVESLDVGDVNDLFKSQE